MKTPFPHGEGLCKRPSTSLNGLRVLAKSREIHHPGLTDLPSPETSEQTGFPFVNIAFVFPLKLWECGYGHFHCTCTGESGSYSCRVGTIHFLARR